MALFALWRAHLTAPRGPASVHAALRAAAHVVPQVEVATAVETRTGRWQLAAFATDTRFLPAAAQVWHDPAGGVCLVHGLLWRTDEAHPRPLAAAAVAALLPDAHTPLPDTVAGEYAVVRLFPDGRLLAFGDPAGLHQLFFAGDGTTLVTNRAGFVPVLTRDRGPDGRTAAWLASIGYRVGGGTARAGVRQLRPDRMLAAGGERPRPGALGLRAGPRGFDQGGEALLATGRTQAQAAIRLAAGDGALDLPVTGGKDSRAVLALALGAVGRERIGGFTRGYPHSPDALAGAALASAAGIPHRREPPLGSDEPADLTLDQFHTRFARLAFQTEGNMGGWDMVTGAQAGTDTLVTGHLGELLKAYAKRALPPVLDAATLIRLQAPFDPLDLLFPHARADLLDEIEGEMAADRAAGAEAADLPDLFYLRHRVPNWLGGIRGVKSFERQPVLPLGVPALARLAFLMTAAERRMELVHYRLATDQPALLAPAFAHQQWSAELPGAPQVPPVLVPPGEPLFGHWQYALNRRPEIRRHLAQLFAAHDLPHWQWLDRAAVRERLAHRQIDYFGGIALLALTVSVYHAAGLCLADRLAPPGHAAPPAPPVAAPVEDASLAVAL